MAEQILDWLGKHLRQTLTEQQNGQQTESRKSSKTRKEKIRAEFKERFPTAEAVTAAFCPSNWIRCLTHLNECLTYPCITLAEVDSVYNAEGLAQSLVELQITAIFRMSVFKTEMGYSSVNEAATNFVANHGNECTLYAMMIYFGKYLSEFKSTFKDFDIADILRQFNVKFLPWWRSLLSHTEPEKPAQTGRPTGIEGLRQYLRNSIREGYDLRQGGLYAMKVITDKDIRQAEEEVRQGIF